MFDITTSIFVVVLTSYILYKMSFLFKKEIDIIKNIEEKDIDNYLGFFEILSDYIDAGSLNVRDVNDEYSDVILTAYNSKEIKEYIAKVRRETNEKEFYIKFETLAKRFSR